MANTRAKKTRTCISQASIDLQSTQSEDLIGSNDDLLTEILIRLPVTSIFRFKSVSKHWRSLLSHRHFTNRYDNLSKSPGLFANDIYIPFDVEDPNTPLKRCIHYYFRRPGVRVLQSCNGLLLCSTDRGPKGRRGVVKYYVFNPTTKQLASIPSVLGGPKVRETICFMGLAFHQTDCVHYKLVCVRYLDSDLEQFQIQIYSSVTRKWKISIQSFTERIRLISPGVYWNGAVYWAPFYGNKRLLYFKVDVEQLQTLTVPVGLLSKENVTMYLGESRGHLHLIATLNYQENRLRTKLCEMLHLNVYEMLSDHSGWFVKYRLQLDEVHRAFWDMIIQYHFFRVIDVVRGEEEEDTFIVLELYEKIVTYNVHAKSFKHIYSLPSCYIRQSSFHRYTESLTSF